jgi:hypothetical protein
MMRVIVLLICVHAGHVGAAHASRCEETPLVQFNGEEVRVEVGKGASSVRLHWRDASRRAAFTEVEMSVEGPCAFYTKIDLSGSTVRVEYWIEALDPEGSVVASAGSAEDPLATVEILDYWCDEPCSCANECGEPEEPLGIRMPPPRRRDLLFRFSSGLTNDAAPMGDIELSYFVRGSTSVGFAARWHEDVVALLRARQFIHGRHGLAVDVSVGGSSAFVIGGGLGYFRALGSQTSWSVEVEALYPIGGSARVGIELRR